MASPRSLVLHCFSPHRKCTCVHFMYTDIKKPATKWNSRPHVGNLPQIPSRLASRSWCPAPLSSSLPFSPHTDSLSSCKDHSVVCPFPSEDTPLQKANTGGDTSRHDTCVTAHLGCVSEDPFNTSKPPSLT